MAKRYTLFVVPDEHSEHVRKIKVTRRALLVAASVLAVSVLCIAAGLSYAGYAAHLAFENDRLRSETVRLATRLNKAATEVEGLTATVERLERFDTKLRSMTQLSDDSRGLAMGPVGLPARNGSLQLGGAEKLVDPVSAELIDAKLGVVERKLDEMKLAALDRERSFTQLEGYLDEQRAVLASTPAIRPAKGIITSTFGPRSDPYTGARTFHDGLDISNDIGTPIVAPADGKVIYASTKDAYGRLIALEHGFGIVTRFAHLSQIDVKVGETVKRGDIIGKLGNSGRSTGPHLHYEVELNGVLVNPLDYILD